jgi:aminopeptidase N
LAILPVLAGMALTGVHAQDMTDKANDPMMKIYRATPAKINDLVHTKLDVRFDYNK